MINAEFTGTTLFDEDYDSTDDFIFEDEKISLATKEKVAVAKAYFAEFYYELFDYLGSVKKRNSQGIAPSNELRTRRFTAMSVPCLFHFGKVAPAITTLRQAGTHAKKKQYMQHSASMLVFDELPTDHQTTDHQTPNHQTSDHQNADPNRRGDTLQNLSKILEKSSHSKEINLRKAHTMHVKVTDKMMLEETKKLLAEKEQMNDLAAQLGKSLLSKIEEYEQQFDVIRSKMEEDEKAMSEYQSEIALWKEKYTILKEKMLIVESHNVRLEEQLEDLHSKHKEEREKVKPFLLRNRSLSSNLSHLEVLKDEVASFQASENNYRRQTELAMKKNSDLEKEIERLKSQLESPMRQDIESAVRYRRSGPVDGNGNTDDVILRELGVSFGEVVSLLRRLLDKMTQIEQESFEYGNTLLVLDTAGKWIEYMQASAQPVIYQTLSNKLIDSGISITTSQKENCITTQKTNSNHNLQLSTLLLTCLISLQLSIDSVSTHEQSDKEWRRKWHVADHELQELRIRARQLEGETIVFQTHIDELKHEVRAAKVKEERDSAKRTSMIDAAVNTEAVRMCESATNTAKIDLKHRETETERIVNAEIGINTEIGEPDNHISSNNLIHTKPGAETISFTSDTNLLLLKETISVRERQELDLLRKEVCSLKEEIGKLSNIHVPSQRITEVTTWEKNYQSDLQEPLIRYINAHLQGHTRLSHVLPANPDRHINRATFDGVLLCVLVCVANPGILDERVINFVPISDAEVFQNFTLTINTAMAMGCTVPTTNPELLLSDPHLMLSMLYQLVKSELEGKLRVEQHPALVRLRKDNETPAKFRSVAASELLQRWTTFHLPNKTPPLNILSQGLSEEDLSTLFSALSHSPMPHQEGQDWVTVLAQQAGVQYPFLGLDTIGNISLQALFLAQLAHASLGLVQLSEIEMKRETEEERDTDPQGTREERAFVMWINGLGIPLFVTSLQHDMGDGLVLLHTLDKIERGSVNWKEVNLNPNNAYKKVENCNLGLKICVSKLSFSLVGIGGKDILDGNRKLILAVVWQACKYHLLAALRACGGGQEITEADVLSFLNKRIPQPITSFKDTSLRTALPLLDLLLHLAVDVVKQENIRRRFPLTTEDCLLNAKYAIGLARKIFVLPPSSSSLSSPPSTSPLCVSSPTAAKEKPSPLQRSYAFPRDIPLCLPLLPEDIVEVNPKMLFIFVAMMMLVDKVKNQAHQNKEYPKG